MAFRFKGRARRLLCPQLIGYGNPKRPRVHAEKAESLQVRLLRLQCVFCGFSLELWGTMRYAVKAPKLSLQAKMDARSRRPAPGGTNPCWSRRLFSRRSSSKGRFSNAA